MCNLFKQQSPAAAIIPATPVTPAAAVSNADGQTKAQVKNYAASSVGGTYTADISNGIASLGGVTPRKRISGINL